MTYKTIFIIAFESWLKLQIKLYIVEMSRIVTFKNQEEIKNLVLLDAKTLLLLSARCCAQSR